MAASGIKSCEIGISDNVLKIDKTLRLLEMAFEMKHKVENVKTENGKRTINLKIGIHKGPCIATVIGYHKPQFSLIGDTVNTTSRVCANVKKDVLISMETYQALIQSDSASTLKKYNFKPYEFEVRDIC